EMFKRADKIFGIAQEEVGRTEPMFNLETERMAERFRAKRRKAIEEREKAEKEKQESDSDSDVAKTPKKGGLPPGVTDGGMLAGGAGLPFDTAGTPSNLGRIGEAGLADADPLGVNTNVSFDDVGGLDDHMFQSLGVTPPRGVLFHGPPGTGKTLVARALAASSRSEGRSVSFFMRKGADCLSKWVGEAERQLRLLFEEAKKVQPSIIFFDEIDGLAPVRSSKQDQIHASIVSTLLALMDGMDGRGQVIVIGATNRPDAIDPALRRPGRFDREFYFPLPNYDARLKILEIMTKKWENWVGEKGEESRKKLAKLTKGYGGADLRALCTEAALNAIQRQYPQIYQSSERLLLDHSKITVQARDFMISVKEVVPSSARSTASVAAPLPPQLAPLLEGSLNEVKTALDTTLPRAKKRSALEEAQWEEDHPDGEAGAFEREMMLQALESQRVNRPRLLLHGPSGMGQRAVGAAALHYLEGFSVQSLDIGTLTGDPSRTPEAAIVQLFIEAKRHAPSIIYIPSLTAMCGSLPETCRALIADSLESLEPHEPILLLAVMTGSFKSLPRDVRAWFAKNAESKIAFSLPDEPKRRHFFQELLDYVKKPPSQFPDAVKRRRRVLEVLPVAPPLPPREPTPAEVAAQERHDTLLFYK
ncbi:4049_t:CDS:2, partial [Acaulospora colombiana]